jgi:hypothetical protein
MWWGYARNQNKKNKKTQMNANNKQKYSAFICAHLRSFAFSVSFNASRGHGPLLQRGVALF